MKRKLVPLLLAVASLSAVTNFGLSWYAPLNTTVLDTSYAYATVQKQKTTPTRTSSLSSTEKGSQASATLLPGSEPAETSGSPIFPGSPESALSQEEMEELSNLRNIKKKLDTRARALDERQRSIEQVEARIGKRIKELEEILARINARLQMEESIKSKKIKRLAAVYASMKPIKAAPVIARMKLPIVVRMFARMDERKVGKILSFLPADKAVQITQALSKKISAIGP